MAFNEDSSASGHDEPWIQWFCGLKGHEMFCEVERSYIEDGFNLYGLRTCVSNFSDCLDLILDRIGPDDSDDSHLTQNACTLYGLIHARYVITAHGLDAMYNKYAAKEFGTCPLVQCAGQPVLPVGLKDEVGTHTVKIFCPKCQCVYHPPPVRSRSNHNIGSGGTVGVDGASFGTTFPHLFLMTFSNLVPDPLPTGSAYIPRVFGFRVHQSARQAPAAATTSPTQMIAIKRGGDADNDGRREGGGGSRHAKLSKDGNTASDKPANKQAFTTSKVPRSSSSSRYQQNNAHNNNTNNQSSNVVAADAAANGANEEEKKRKADSKQPSAGDNATNGDSKRRKRSEP
eukprot:CAMPEP_0119006764 /NCGR_PEP_ID=MMETSP1176-20130426/2520_1 /TAXON_ID=265551 /ORGANISM="Synedropsis recta cf, Strain CCMP1620" /LENGTH=342 /DNA_ID=CAMNT_0006958751 /DNA_START=186 /DNA_END=1214 /DNA_ORIENTATION=-